MTIPVQPTPHAFIFDMDGTLIDNMPFHNRVWTAYLAELGVTANPHSFHEQTAGKTNPEILRLFLGQDLPDTDVEVHSLEKETRYRSLYRESAQPLPGLLAFLEGARRAGIALGLATSAGRENIDFVLGLLGLADTFQTIIGAEQVQRGKPNPQAFLLAAQGLGIAPASCLVFEDSYKGIEAAHRAGMPVVAILTELTAQQALALPGVVQAAEDYTGLKEWFAV